MEREPIPVISTQVSIIALLYLGYLWIIGEIPTLFEGNYYLGLGAVLIIVGPVISQIIYGIWKKYFGFRSYDVTKHLCKGLLNDQSFEIQMAFDNYWHNSDNVNDKIIEYSRRRSVVCQMNLFASRILGFGSLIYLIISFLEPTIYWKSLILFLVSGLSAVLFEINFGISSSELIKVEARNIRPTLSSAIGYIEFRNAYLNITGKDFEIILNKLRQ